VSAVARKYLRTTWVYIIVSATLPPMILIAADALWRGHLDTWATIAFVVAWLIALVFALAYLAIVRLAAKKKGRAANEPNESASP
jgi:hypothetical protein